MSVQTSYDIDHEVGYPGLFADLNPKTVVSKLAETNITMGRVVSRGSSEDQILMGGSVPFGIAGRDLGREAYNLDGDIRVNAEDDCPVMLEGFVYVQIKSASGSPGDPITYDKSTGELFAGFDPTRGALNATLEQTVSAVDQIALIRLDSPALRGIAGGIVFKGAIATASDFPTPAEVQIGDTYICTADVTDNDPTKTNTGDSFLEDAEITWSGVAWIELGQVLLNSTDKQKVAASDQDILFIATKSGKLTNVDATVLTGAGAGESMNIAVRKGGTNMLSANITLDQASGTSVVSGSIDPINGNFSAGDVISVVRTYNAGGTPAPMTDSAVTVKYTG